MFFKEVQDYPTKTRDLKRIARLALRLKAEKLVVEIVTSRLITPKANPDKLRQVP